MAKYIVGILVIIILGIGGYYWWKTSGTASPVPEPTPQTPTTHTYATSTFSVVYPDGYAADEAYAYDQVDPKKPISGVKFTIPLTIATGTNLSNDSYVSVEWLPRAKNCTGDIYLAANVKPRDMTISSTTYSTASSTGAAAGNLYEEWVYAIKDSRPCTAVRYFIHSMNIGNFEPGVVSEFDHGALMSTFDQIRDSLSFTPAGTTTPAI
ncbi:MAG: hypothetical protein RLZZ416_232 [Candidatus Parcubacteria bacterium]|jgi:hypothetical protein